MLLRGFDRDMVNKIHTYMTAAGTKIIIGVLPTKIEKRGNGRLLVTYSNGSSDEFDTVIAAVGRYVC